MRTLSIALGITCLLSARHSLAQTCAGAAPFSSGPVRLGAGFSVSDDVKGFGAELAAGSRIGPFGSVTVSRADYDGVENSGTVVALQGGYSIDLIPAKTVQFCPLAAFIHQSGPDATVGTTKVSTSGHSFSFGGSFGGTVPLSPALDFVPFARAGYTHSKATASAGGVSLSNAESYAEIGMGAGFVVNKRLTLQPLVSFPVGLDDGDATFQLAFAFNFGSARPTAR